jgi:hypothetical protein
VYPLFNTPSVNFQKTVQTKFWAEPVGYQMEKTVNRYWMLAQYYSLNSTEVDVSFDNELNTGTYDSVPITPPTVTWLNNAAVTVVWQNNVAATATWFTTGLATSQPMAKSQAGVLNGWTVKTLCDDMAIVSMMVEPQQAGYRG